MTTRADEKHVVTMQLAPTVGGHGLTWWQAKCSCGRYTSTRYAYRGRAEAAGAEHVRSKSAAATTTSEDYRQEEA